MATQITGRQALDLLLAQRISLNEAINGMMALAEFDRKDRVTRVNDIKARALAGGVDLSRWNGVFPAQDQ